MAGEGAQRSPVPCDLRRNFVSAALSGARVRGRGRTGTVVAAFISRHPVPQPWRDPKGVDGAAGEPFGAPGQRDAERRRVAGEGVRQPNVTVLQENPVVLVEPGQLCSDYGVKRVGEQEARTWAGRRPPMRSVRSRRKRAAISGPCTTSASDSCRHRRIWEGAAEQLRAPRGSLLVRAGSAGRSGSGRPARSTPPS